MTNGRLGSAVIAEEWWHDCISEESDQRAVRARLRRTGAPLDVMQEPEALRLVATLSARGEDPERVAVLAGILAFVRERDERHVARAIGRVSLDNDDNPPPLMSESRFRRLLQVSGNELMEPMRRLVRLTKGKANVYDLSFSVLRWGDRVKRRMIFEYYNVSNGGLPRGAAPGSPTPDSSST